MKLLHIGYPVFEKMEGMMYADSLKVWFTDPSTNPYNIEFVYFEPDCPMAAAIQDTVHIAYQVDNIEEAVKGKSILWPICEPGPGMKIAFVYDQGTPIEFVQLG